MSTATYIVGEARAVLAGMEPGSVNSLITSPPYPWQRAYLPPGHPDKALVLGQEPDPAAAIDALLDVMDLAWDVLTDDATFWLVLGDAHAGSGGSGGDYNEGGMRDGQQRYDGTAVKARRAGEANGDRPRQARDRWRDPEAKVRSAPRAAHGQAEKDWAPRAMEGLWPREQSVCWWPHLVGASMAYGHNLLNGNEHRQWVTRPPITWCKPAPTPGALTRRFRTATELILYGGKRQDHYFDLDSVRTPLARDYTGEAPSGLTERDRQGRGRTTTCRESVANEKGAPPLNWWEVDYPAEHVDPDYWVVNTSGYPGAHFATYPPALLVRPVLAGCPIGGTILDPFAGTFTTALVANGHGRNAIGIDLDARNAELARERIGMFLDVVTPSAEVPA